MESLLSWFALKSVPGIGNHLFKRLVERFESPAAVFEAPVKMLADVEGVSPRVAERLRGHRVSDAVRTELERTLERGYTVVTFTDPHYPPLLREIHDPPPYLYVRGTLDATPKAVALVGSRMATDYGLRTTRRLAAELAGEGFLVVSGMALGIDTAAHQGALMGGGRTVAVLGSGLDNLYPRENRKLADRIAQNGAVVTEFALTDEPAAHHFPARNRIISGMTQGTVVVEATRRSGSLITARLAAEQNREVFAVPGSIQSFKSSGTHTLIKEGAKLVEHTGDILEELRGFAQMQPTPGGRRATPAATRSAPPLTGEERRIFDALEPYPEQVDALARRLGLPSGELLAILLQLELKGLVRQTPGAHFERNDK